MLLLIDLHSCFHIAIVNISHHSMRNKRRPAEVLLTPILHAPNVIPEVQVESLSAAAAVPLTFPTEESASATHDSKPSIMRVPKDARVLTANSNAHEDQPTAARTIISATAKVFHTTELLEAILAEVPNQQLLLRQRTCKNFRDTIRGSLRLQRKLYFAATGSESDALIVNPLIDTFSTSRVPCNARPYGIGGTAAIQEDYEVQYAFRYQGKVFALGKLGEFHRMGDEPRPAWSVMVATHTEICSAKIFDISNTSLWSILLCQQPKNFVVHVYGGDRVCERGEARVPLIGRLKACGSIGEILEQVSQAEKDYSGCEGPVWME